MIYFTKFVESLQFKPVVCYYNSFAIHIHVYVMYTKKSLMERVKNKIVNKHRYKLVFLNPYKQELGLSRKEHVPTLL